MNMPNVNVRRGDTGFTDRDLMQVVLDEHKLSISSLAKGAIEAASPDLRRQIMNSLDTDLRHQKEIWDLMNRKGWYQPAVAQPQDVARVQNFASTMQQHV